MQATTAPRHTTPLQQFLRDSSPGAFLGGLTAVIVAFAGPTVLVYAAAQSAGLNERAMMSWVWASTVLCGLIGIWLSLRTRTPIVSTWSTPGIAFLATALTGVPFPVAVGAFVTSSVLVFLLGAVRPLTHAAGKIPPHLAGALNAAILLPFGFQAVQALARQPALVGAMIVMYLVLRSRTPRWAVAGVLLVAIVGSAALGLLRPADISFSPTVPQVVLPQFTWQATLSLALPLTVLAFTGQFVPGLAVLQASGYHPDAGRIVRTCGAVSLGAALLGCHNLTLGALIANVVTGPDAHPDPARRYTAAVWAGALFVLFGLFAGTFLAVMSALPPEGVQALAGLALLGATASSLQTALRGEGQATTVSLAAPAVLVVTLSGVVLLGIGAAFWGLLAGLLLHAVEGWQARRAGI